MLKIGEFLGMISIALIPTTAIGCSWQENSFNNFQEVIVTPDYVYDGDTIYLSDSELISDPNNSKNELESRVRFFGIDTPEIKGSSSLQNEWARLAKEFLQDLVTPTLKLYVIDVDNYNRAIVIPKTTKEIDLSIELLKNGLALEVASKYKLPDLWESNNDFYLKELANAQKEAMDSEIGIWSLASEELAEIYPNID